jgi:hypothetical protein
VPSRLLREFLTNINSHSQGLVETDLGAVLQHLLEEKINVNDASERRGRARDAGERGRAT